MGPTSDTLGSGVGHLVLLLPLVTGLAFDTGGGADDFHDVVEALGSSNVTDADPAGALQLWLSGARKCCPPGMKMFRVDAPGCENEVTCRILDWETSGAAGHLFALGDSDDFYGFPTSCPREDCPLLVLGEPGAAVAKPYCVDKLVQLDAEGRVTSERIAGKACVSRGLQPQRLRLTAASGASEMADATTLKVTPFLKCCPLRQVYELATRSCVYSPQFNTSEDGLGSLSGSTPPAVDLQRSVISPLLTRVFDRERTSFVDVSVGFPHCVEAALDVAVFDLAADKFLVDGEGNALLSPTIRLGDGGTANWKLKPGHFCVDDTKNMSGTLVVKVCRNDTEDVCRKFGCFKKCCPQNSYFLPNGPRHVCVPKPAERPLLFQVHVVPESINASLDYVPVSNEDLVDAAYQTSIVNQAWQQVLYPTVTENICPDFRYRLSEEMGDVWFFDQNGVLYMPDYPAEDIVVNQYCVEDSADVEGVSVLLCLPEMDPTQVDENYRILLITVGLLISCLFLALTLGTYCCLPALQNLHGKTLMCHVSSLLVAYLFLAMTQLLTKVVFVENEWICSIIGNCVLFTFLSAFSWLNVMCFDIWRTFGAMKSSRSLKRSSASRRFRWYCVYAWGLSSAITIMCVIVDQWPGNDKNVFRPQMGDGSCWFRTDTQGKAYGILIFFVGPLLVQTCSNLLLFVLTVRNYSRIKNEINRLHNPPSSRKVKKFQADSNKLKMNLKLFVVMGVTWVLELVSTFFPDDQAVFYLSDTANALQGVMIFAIFVLKRKVVRALAVRLGRAPPPTSLSANPSLTLHTDSRLAVRGKTASSSTLFTSEFRCSAVSSRNVETSQ